MRKARPRRVVRSPMRARLPFEASYASFARRADSAASRSAKGTKVAPSSRSSRSRFLRLRSSERSLLLSELPFSSLKVLPSSMSFGRSRFLSARSCERSLFLPELPFSSLKVLPSFTMSMTSFRSIENASATALAAVTALRASFSVRLKVSKTRRSGFLDSRSALTLRSTDSLRARPAAEFCSAASSNAASMSPISGAGSPPMSSSPSIAASASSPPMSPRSASSPRPISPPSSGASWSCAPMAMSLVMSPLTEPSSLATSLAMESLAALMASVVWRSLAVVVSLKASASSGPNVRRMPSSMGMISLASTFARSSAIPWSFSRIDFAARTTSAFSSSLSIRNARPRVFAAVSRTGFLVDIRF